ncbi:Protein BIM1 [Pseudozyma hubeiensis]|nr:Protein BIM1 [Pseudozyma hubeiensis]
MGESRTELIQWINTLLSLSYTKIEQLGSGAAYAQIIDSIFYNVPLAKIKFDAKHDYEYINNFKVLQETFKRNRIDKPIPVDRLIRCKMQDNLEFAQWLKRYWDQNFSGELYDAEGRRGGVGAQPPPLVGSVSVGAARTTRAAPPAAAPASRAPAARTAPVQAARRPAPGAARAAPQQAQPAVPNETIQALTAQMDDMKVSVDSLEKERDFYFAKLRDIEILVQERLGLLAEQFPVPSEEEDPEGLHVGTEEQESLKQIQAILYSTEEGFEVPEGEGLEGEEALVGGEEDEMF